MNPITMNLVVDEAIRRALQEDITSEDISTMSVCPEARPAEVQLIAKQEGVIAGLGVFERAFTLLDPATRIEARVADGDRVGARAAARHGVWRCARAAVGRAGGAQLSAAYERRGHVYASNGRCARGTGTLLADTRKTTPGMRIFEKEAVRLGGGANHRYNLSSAVMLKDNHIDAAGGIAAAVAGARAHASFTCTVEVECETLEMVREALDAGADIIMLDNMGRDQMAERSR